MTKKTAISLPDDLYREIERARKRANKDRSGFIQEALGEYLVRHDTAAKVRAYFDGYSKIPDDDEDFRAIAEYGIKRLRRAER